MLHPTCGGFVEGRIGMARLCNAYPYRRRFWANRGDDHCPNSSDLGADGTNRRELISCETLLAGWLAMAFTRSFFSQLHAIAIATSSILFCFQYSLSCSAFAMSGGMSSSLRVFHALLTAFLFSIVGFQKYRRRQTPGGGRRLGGGIAGSAAPQPY
jgi:hypothetical protein